MSNWRNSQLPKQVDVRQSAVPVFTSVGDSAMLFTSTLTDMQVLAITNTTASTINITVTDGNDVAVGNLSSYPVDPNTPYVLDFIPYIRCDGGVKIYAPSAGLDVTIHGWRQARFTTSNV